MRAHVRTSVQEVCVYANSFSVIPTCHPLLQSHGQVYPFESSGREAARKAPPGGGEAAAAYAFEDLEGQRCAGGGRPQTSKGFDAEAIRECSR